MPTVLSVNVAQPRRMQVGARTIVSGIHKEPQAGRVAVGPLGLGGDHVMNQKHHGGPDQAVYLYTAADMDYWNEVRGEAPLPSQFGENLHLSEGETAGWRVGDRLTFFAPDGTPGPVLEVTAPRIPCATLAAHVGDPAFVKAFVRAGRPGAYTRVLQGGEIGVGDRWERHEVDVAAPTLGDLFALWYEKSPDGARLRAALAYPIGLRLRAAIEEQLQDRGEAVGH